jgi:hypothetical protein
MRLPANLPVIIRLYAAAALPYGTRMFGLTTRSMMKTMKPSDGVVRMCAS